MAEGYSLKRPQYIKKRKRVGRGNASGHGTSCGSGHDGQMGRSGRERRPWFEGGQMPLQRRVPKRGFKNFNRVVYQIVNVSQIERCGAASLDPSEMAKRGLIDKTDRPVKILGSGDLSKPVRVVADAFSKQAREKIVKAGGEAAFRADTPKSESPDK